MSFSRMARCRTRNRAGRVRTSLRSRGCLRPRMRVPAPTRESRFPGRPPRPGARGRAGPTPSTVTRRRTSRRPRRIASSLVCRGQRTPTPPRPTQRPSTTWFAPKTTRPVRTARTTAVSPMTIPPIARHATTRPSLFLPIWAQPFALRPSITCTCGSPGRRERERPAMMSCAPTTPR